MVAWSKEKITYIVRVLEQMLYFYDDDDAPTEASLRCFACYVIQLRLCGYKGVSLGLKYIKRDVASLAMATVQKQTH